jgi:hypothetical protein
MGKVEMDDDHGGKDYHDKMKTHLVIKEKKLSH